MFGLTYDTGLRINELISLLIRDVHLDRKQVHIPATPGKRYLSVGRWVLWFVRIFSQFDIFIRWCGISNIKGISVISKIKTRYIFL